jgi:hypothetical protein
VLDEGRMAAADRRRATEVGRDRARVRECRPIDRGHRVGAQDDGCAGRTIASLGGGAV